MGIRPDSTVWLIVLSCGLAALAPTSAHADDGPDAAQQAYLSANGLLNRGLFELAAAEYRKFLAEYEDHEKGSVAHYGLGVCLFRMNQHVAALEELAPLAKHRQFEFAAEAGTIAGQCLLTLNQPDRAAKFFQRVVNEHEDHSLTDDAAAGLVEAFYLSKRYDEAIAVSEAFAQRWNKNPLRERVTFFHGLSAMAERDYATAAERLAELLKKFPKGPFVDQASLLLAQCYQQDSASQKAVRQYRAVLKNKESKYTADALLGLATLLHQAGELHEAGQRLDQLLKKYPDSELLSSAWMRRGRVWFDHGDYGKAAEAFAAVLDGDEALTGEAEYWSAKCDLRSGRYDDAEARLAKTYERHSASALAAEMLYDRAIALLRIEKNESAIEVLETFRSRFPQHELAPDALQLLAVTEHQRRNYDASQGHAGRFLNEYSNHPLTPSVLFLVGENDFLSERFKRAARAYDAFLEAFPDDSRTARTTYRLGMAHFRLQRFDKAVPLLQQIEEQAKEDDSFRTALLALGDIHFQRNDWPVAEGYLGTYLARGDDLPAADDALLKLGLSQQRQENHEDALRSYDRFLERFEDSPHRLQAVFERGQVLVALGHLDDAAVAFEAVLDQAADSRFVPYALNHLAAIATQHNEFDAAASLYQEAASTAPKDDLAADALFQHAQSLMAARHFAEAEGAFTQFAEQYPKHARVAEAFAQRAITLSRQDRHEPALEAIQETERRWASDLQPSLSAALAYEKAWCLKAVGRSKEAAKAYRDLIKEGLAGDYHAHALLELAAIQMDAERFADAAKRLRRLRDLASSAEASVSAELLEQTLYRLGVCEFKLERLKEATGALELFVEQFPDSTLLASASFFAGEAFFELGKHKQAARHLARVAERFPDDAVYGPALLRLGEAQASLQQWGKSERTFTDYLEQFRESKQWFQAQFGIGWAREHQKHYDEAANAYRLVTRRHQGETAARAQFQIGECLFAKGDFSNAVSELLKVDILYAYPQWSAAALYEAGRCFEKLGKIIEARAHFKQVGEQHGDTKWAELASERLSELPGVGVPGR